MDGAVQGRVRAGHHLGQDAGCRGESSRNGWKKVRAGRRTRFALSFWRSARSTSGSDLAAELVRDGVRVCSSGSVVFILFLRVAANSCGVRLLRGLRGR